MRRCLLPLFLVFLLLSGMADDLFASWTADPADDLMAAANNTYVGARDAQPRPEHPAHRPPGPSPAAAVAPALPPAAFARAGDEAPAFRAPSGAELRYRLGSVQF